MPDTALPTTEIPAPALAAQAVALHRKPALPGFLFRSIGRINWIEGVPDVWSLRWILEACKAELVWSRSDYDRVSRGVYSDRVDMYDGPHPEQCHRLPHERMAARVLNAWGHAGDGSYRIRELILTLKAQRGAANDDTQNDAYRSAWLGVSKTTERQIADLWKRRREAWTVLLAAMRAYRALRDELGPMDDREAA